MVSEAGPEAEHQASPDLYYDYDDAAVSLTVQSSTACTTGAPATRASLRTTSYTGCQFSTGTGLSNEPKYPKYDHDHDEHGNGRESSSSSSSAAVTGTRVSVVLSRFMKFDFRGQCGCCVRRSPD